MGDPARILKFLYLGDKQAAKNKEALQRLGITYVVNVTESRGEGGVHNHFESQGQFTYKRIPVQDSIGADLSQYFDEAAAFIDEAKASGYSVLVHCQQGVSRSPTVVLSYLMLRCHMTLKQAYVLVKTARPEAKPKTNFLRQLTDLEARLRRDPAWLAKAGAAVADSASPVMAPSPSPPPSSGESTDGREGDGEGAAAARKSYGAALPPSLLPASGVGVAAAAEPAPAPMPADATTPSASVAAPSAKRTYGMALPPGMQPAAAGAGADESGASSTPGAAESAPKRKEYGAALPPAPPQNASKPPEADDGAKKRKVYGVAMPAAH
jgi:hypothetical protein